jgi:uncharacterized protein (TIGR02265 family)
MKQKREKLGDKASVKGTMLQAHVDWARGKYPGIVERIVPKVGEQSRAYLTGAHLVTEWVPFRCLMEIDRAIAEGIGGVPDETFRLLGYNSAQQNLAGVYKSFVADEPHRFFDRGARLHDRFQNFGKAEYAQVSERAGRMRITGYEEYSPVYCQSALGYYKGVLEYMKVPGPIRVAETECQCAGDEACVYELSW